MRRLFALLVGLVVIGQLAGLAQARTATFTPSADHNTVDNGVPRLTSYALQITPTSSGVSGPDIPLGKPAVVGGVIVVSPAALQTLAPGTYIAQVFAIGPGGRSAGSTVSDPFVVLTPAPLPTGKPVIQ
jgi:hypothetical protein